jgi:hypothetical protein
VSPEDNAWEKAEAERDRLSVIVGADLIDSFEHAVSWLTLARSSRDADALTERGRASADEAREALALALAERETLRAALDHERNNVEAVTSRAERTYDVMLKARVERNAAVDALVSERQETARLRAEVGRLRAALLNAAGLLRGLGYCSEANALEADL